MVRNFEKRAIKYYKNELQNGSAKLYNRVIRPEEYQQLLHCYARYSHYRLIFQFMWETGCRVAEACWLNIKDFSPDFKLCRMKEVKGKVIINGEEYPNTREVWLSDGLAQQLQYWWENNKYHSRWGFIFPAREGKNYSRTRLFINPYSVLDQLHQLRKQGRITGRWAQKMPNGHYVLGSHSFRRTWVYNYGIKHKIWETCKAIGHSKPRTTLKYLPPAPPEHLKQQSESCWRITANAQTFIPKEQATLGKFIT